MTKRQKEKKQRFCLLLTPILTPQQIKAGTISWASLKKKKSIQLKAIKNTKKKGTSPVLIKQNVFPSQYMLIFFVLLNESIVLHANISFWALCNQLSNNAPFDCFPSLAIHHIQWWVFICVYLQVEEAHPSICKSGIGSISKDIHSATLFWKSLSKYLSKVGCISHLILWHIFPTSSIKNLLLIAE